MKRSGNARRFAGYTLVSIGVLANKWILEYTLVPDGSIESLSLNLVVFAFNLVCVTAGWITIVRSEDELKKLGLNLLILGLSLVLLTGCLAALEWISYTILRYRLPERSKTFVRRHPVVGGVPPLHVDENVFQTIASFHPLWGWQAGLIFNRDRFGFRLNDPGDTRAWDPGADRHVVMVGGSTVAGYPSPVQKTIPAHLERLLNREGVETYNVVNAGVGGWFSSNELAFLTQRVIPFHEPDAIVVLNGVNEVPRAARAAGRLSRQNRRAETGTNFLVDPRLDKQRRQFQRLQNDPLFVFNQFLWALGVSTYFRPSRYFTGRLTAAMLAAHERPSASFDLESVDCREHPLNTDLSRQNIRSMLETSRAQDIPIVYALQPSIVFKRPLTPPEKLTLRRQNYSYFSEGDPKFDVPPGVCWENLHARFFRRMTSSLEDLRDRYPSPSTAILDLSSLFRGNRNFVFVDYLHYNSRGNRSIARRLKPAVQNVLHETDRQP